MVDGHSLSLSDLSCVCGDVAVYTYHVTCICSRFDPLGWGYVIGFLEGEEHIQTGRTYSIHSDNLSTGRKYRGSSSLKASQTYSLQTRNLLS